MEEANITMYDKRKEKRTDDKFHFLAFVFIILAILVAVFSVAGVSSVTASLNNFIGSGKQDYAGALKNIDQMDAIVSEQELLISNYLLNQIDYPPSEDFYQLTKSFKELYDIEYEYADTREEINYTYHIITRHNTLVDMFSRLLSYMNAFPPEPETAYAYYKNEISVQFGGLHTALANYREYKEDEMFWAKELSLTSIGTTFGVMFAFFVVSLILIYYLFKRILRINLTPVYSILEEQKQLEKMKSDFVSTISHEFKTPLTSIIMGADLLRNNLLGDLNEEQEEIVDTMAEDGMRLNVLVTNLLELSKIESSNTVYAFEEKDVENIIRNALIPFIGIAKKSDIDLTFEPTLPLPSALIDESKITWVMNNLLTNALKHTRENGTISIKVYPDESDFITVSVQDSGSGIPEEYLENIFERYFQVQDSDMEMGGTGLGLAISKDIVNAHGGEIWCSSIINEGSTFYFTLPPNKKQEKEG